MICFAHEEDSTICSWRQLLVSKRTFRFLARRYVSERKSLISAKRSSVGAKMIVIHIAVTE